MTRPLTPNFVPGVGALTTYRDDFQAHIDGTGFRQNATTIDLSPPLDGYTTVQALLAGIVGDLNPTLPDASPTNLGLTTLAGDFNGIGTNAFSPKVGGLQGYPIQKLAPAAGQVLAGSGSYWGPVSIGGNVTGPITNETVVAVTGDVGGTLNIGTAGTTGLINIGGAAVFEVIIGNNSGGPTIQLGDTGGASTILMPNLNVPNALMLALSGGQVSYALGLTYTSSFNVAAPLMTTSSISVGFTDVTPSMLTVAYTVDSGSTPDYLLLVEDNTPRIINLPAAVAGRVLKIKDAAGSAGDNNIVINAAGSDTFEDGSSSKTITVPFGVVELIAGTITAGTLWFITGVYNSAITL